MHLQLNGEYSVKELAEKIKDFNRKVEIKVISEGKGSTHKGVILASVEGNKPIGVGRSELAYDENIALVNLRLAEAFGYKLPANEKFDQYADGYAISYLNNNYFNKLDITTSKGYPHQKMIRDKDSAMHILEEVMKCELLVKLLTYQPADLDDIIDAYFAKK